MMNGDAFFDINLRALEQASHQSGAMATLALRSVPDAARYGRVIEDQGKVVAFLEKDANRPGPGIINGGIYVLKREILDLVHDLPCSLEQDVFPALVERGAIQGVRVRRLFPRYRAARNARTGASGAAQRAGASRRLSRPERARQFRRGRFISAGGVSMDERARSRPSAR